MADLNRIEYLAGAVSVLGLTAGCTGNSDIEAEDIDSYESPESPPGERNHDGIEYNFKGGLPDDMKKI